MVSFFGLIDENKVLLIFVVAVFSCGLHAQNKFENNKKSGKWLETDEREHVFAEGTYKDGEFDGPWEIYYENGQLEIKGNYKKGQMHGPFEIYCKNGELKTKTKRLKRNERTTMTI